MKVTYDKERWLKGPLIPIHERIALLPDDVCMYIGSVTGNSFFFIGTKKELDIYGRRVDRDLKEAHKRSYENANRRNNTKLAAFWEEQYRNFTSFLDKLSYEPYNRLKRDGIVIITDGFERGHFWDREEFEAVYRHRLL